MRAGLSSSEKQPAFELGWGLFRKAPHPSLPTPHLLAMAPPTRTPSGWHPRLSHPPPQGSYQPHTTTTTPILSPTPGLWPAVGHRHHPPLQYLGLFQAPPPSLHPGTGVSSTPRPTSPISGKPADSEPGPPIQSLPVTYRYLPPLFLFSGFRVDNPPPFSAPYPPN